MRCHTVLVMLLGIFIGNMGYAESVSLRDKIGQMIIIGFDGKQIDKNSPIVKTIQNENIGGVILFDYNPKKKNDDKNIESPDQVHQLNSNLQHYNYLAQKKFSRPHLPLLISVDYEGGEKGTRLNPANGFPATVNASSVGHMSVQQASEVAETMGSTLKKAGFNLNFAPVMDVNVNPDSPIIGKFGRSFSDNAHEVGVYADIFSSSYLDKKIQCAYKHFPGHGSATGDSHLGFVDVSETWQPRELEPYEIILGEDQSCGMVMTAHLINRQLDESGLPATLSHKVLTELLRDKLNFKGVVITDDMQMKAIADHYSLDKAVVMAVNAGADMIMFANQLSDVPQDPKVVIDLIESKVRTGEIREQRINEAYNRIVGLKETLE